MPVPPCSLDRGALFCPSSIKGDILAEILHDMRCFDQEKHDRCFVALYFYVNVGYNSVVVIDELY